MDARRAHTIISRAARRGGDAVQFTEHALFESMPDDGVFVEDVLHALLHAEALEPENDARTKWKVYGPLVSRESYAVVVMILDDEHVRVPTTHKPP